MLSGSSALAAQHRNSPKSLLTLRRKCFVLRGPSSLASQLFHPCIPVFLVRQVFLSFKSVLPCQSSDLSHSFLVVVKVRGSCHNFVRIAVVLVSGGESGVQCRWPNTACTRRRGVCAFFESFQRLSRFLLSSLVHTPPRRW